MLKIIINHTSVKTIVLTGGKGVSLTNNTARNNNELLNEKTMVSIAKGGVKQLDDFFNKMASNDDMLVVLVLNKALTNKYFRGSLRKKWEHSDIEKCSIARESHYVSLYRDNVLSIADINEAYAAVAAMGDDKVKNTLLDALVRKFSNGLWGLSGSHEVTLEELLRHRAVISALSYRASLLKEQLEIQGTPLAGIAMEQERLFICADRAPLIRK